MPPVSQLTTQCGGKHICAGVPSWSFDAVLMPYTGATLTQCKSRTETLLTSKHSKPRSAISKALFFFSSRSIARYWLLVTALALPCMARHRMSTQVRRQRQKPTPSQRPAETSPACIAKHMPPRQGGLATPDLTRCSTPQLRCLRRPFRADIQQQSGTLGWVFDENLQTLISCAI